MARVARLGWCSQSCFVFFVFFLTERRLDNLCGSHIKLIMIVLLHILFLKDQAAVFTSRLLLTTRLYILFLSFFHHENARNAVHVFLIFPRVACPRTPLDVCTFTRAPRIPSRKMLASPNARVSSVTVFSHAYGLTWHRQPTWNCQNQSGDSN